MHIEVLVEDSSGAKLIDILLPPTIGHQGAPHTSVCGTWELLADAIHPGGVAAIQKAGWPLPGEIKHGWAESIGPLMNIELNQSPSFRKFRDGLRRIVA